MHVADALGNWHERPGPLYRRLASALQDAIERGDLAAGSVLPAERSLAVRLTVARSTVVGAYNALREAGLVESQQGSGTWVAGSTRSSVDSARSPEALRAAALSSQSVIDLATASLPADPSVLRAMRSCLTEPDTEVLASAGYFRHGLPSLREAISRYLSDLGHPTSPSEVLVVTGVQQAYSLIADHFLDAGDIAVVPDPTSAGLLDVLRTLPVTIRSSPSSNRPDGVAPLISAIERHDVRLAFLSSTLDVAGDVMPPAELSAVAAAMDRWSGVVVCDESQRELLFETAPARLPVRTENPTVITVGSLSKLYWGGLRVGWIRAAEPVIARLGRTKARADLGTPVLSQLVAARLLTDIAETRARRLEQISHQLEYAISAMERNLPGFAFRRPSGGLTLWVRLPSGLSEPLVEVALREGVAVVPGSLLSQHGAGDEFIRVTYARPPAEFEEGVRRLARAWETYRDRMADTGPSGHGPMAIDGTITV